MFLEHIVKVGTGSARTGHIAANVTAFLSAKADSQAARAGLIVERVCRVEQCV